MYKFLINVYRYIFAKKYFIKLNLLLYNFGIRGIGVLNYENDNVSGEKRFLKDYFKHLKNGLVFDVGANIGNYSMGLKYIEPSTRIIAFEPHPLTFEKLQSCAMEHDFTACNVAVGNSTEKYKKLYDYLDEDGSSHASLYKEVIETVHKRRAVEHVVSNISLDDYVSENGIERINLLKIDTEGNEMEVLKGFANFIKAGKVDAIHFEFNEMNVISRVFFKDFWDLLSNYDFYRMLPGGLLPIKYYNPVECEVFAYQNIVAILKKQ